MTNDTDKYEPIECGLHSEYELAIMHQIKVMLSWQETGKTTQTEEVKPINMIVRDKQEFIKVRTNNNKDIEIRLDNIVAFKPLA
jgi:Rho-binding antiterminator